MKLRRHHLLLLAPVLLAAALKHHWLHRRALTLSRVRHDGPTHGMELSLTLRRLIQVNSARALP